MMAQPENNSQSSDIIEQWFGDITPENELQSTVMLHFANLFEKYVTQEDNLNAADITSATNDVFQNPTDIFHPTVLSNQDIVHHIYSQLIGMGLKPDPDLPKNSRIAYKVCHIVFHGNSNAELREQSMHGIKEYYSSLKKSRRESTANVNTGRTPTQEARTIGSSSSQSTTHEKQNVHPVTNQENPLHLLAQALSQYLNTSNINPLTIGAVHQAQAGQEILLLYSM